MKNITELKASNIVNKKIGTNKRVYKKIPYGHKAEKPFISLLGLPISCTLSIFSGRIIFCTFVDTH